MITRDAFLYMDPSGKRQTEFGQCATCRMAVPVGDRTICSLLDIEVDAGDSCGLYVPGPADKTEAQHISGDVSPEDAGYVKRDVRCENCRYFDPDESDCELFEMLSAARPDVFDLDPRVEARGCCNAQEPLTARGRVGEKFEKLRG